MPNRKPTMFTFWWKIASLTKMGWYRYGLRTWPWIYIIQFLLRILPSITKTTKYLMRIVRLSELQLFTKMNFWPITTTESYFWRIQRADGLKRWAKLQIGCNSKYNLARLLQFKSCSQTLISQNKTWSDTRKLSIPNFTVSPAKKVEFWNSRTSHKSWFKGAYFNRFKAELLFFMTPQ